MDCGNKSNLIYIYTNPLKYYNLQTTLIRN